MSETTLQQLKKDAREELESQIADGTVDSCNIDRIIFEEADSQTPVMNSELLEIAASDNSVALRTPESGDTGTPIEVIGWNIYELLSEDLWSYWHSLEGYWVCKKCSAIVDPDDLVYEKGSPEDPLELEPEYCPNCLEICIELEH